MGTFDVITGYLRGNTRNKRASGGRCPNSWGRQEYEGIYLEAASKSEHIDLNNIVQKKGWIQAYVEKYFEGLHEHNAEGHPGIHQAHSARYTYRSF
ncbi:MAG: hypothetical protein H6569_06050 [Lewinellaceae bacterium]|nr:hypothetical protein [Lewinellaceae bacterium]